MKRRKCTIYVQLIKKVFNTRLSCIIKINLLAKDSIAIIFNSEQFRGEKVVTSFYAVATFKRRVELSMCSEPGQEEKQSIAPKRLRLNEFPIKPITRLYIIRVALGDLIAL